MVFQQLSPLSHKMMKEWFEIGSVQMICNLYSHELKFERVKWIVTRQIVPNGTFVNLMWSYCVCTSAIKVPRNDRVMHREAVCQPSYLVHLSHLPSLHSRHRQASCASSCSSFVPYWKSPKLYRQLWTSQVLISVPSLLCWNANITGKSAQRASKNIVCMLPRTLVKCRSVLHCRMISYLLKIDLLIF